MRTLSSQRIRAYFPATLARTAALWTDGIAVDEPRTAFTVSDAERASSQDNSRSEKPDEEALEYAAFRRAAAAAREAAEEETTMVVSADVADDDIGADGNLVHDVAVSEVVSFHVGDDLLWYDASEAADLLR